MSSNTVPLDLSKMSDQEIGEAVRNIVSSSLTPLQARHRLVVELGFLYSKTAVSELTGAASSDCQRLKDGTPVAVKLSLPGGKSLEL